MRSDHSEAAYQAWPANYIQNTGYLIRMWNYLGHRFFRGREGQHGWGTKKIALSIGFFAGVYWIGTTMFDWIKEPQPEPVTTTESTQDEPRGRRDYVYVNAITEVLTRDDGSIFDPLYKGADKLKDMVTGGLQSTGDFIMRVLKTSVILGILGVTYKMFKIVDD